LDRLPADLREEFKRVYRDKLRELYPGSPVFYGFRRTLFAATLA
jgi:trans-aconitate 2-methyltransferase